MVKNDNIEVTQRQPLILDGIFSLLLSFLRVCEELSKSARFSFLCGSFVQKMKCQEPLCCSKSVIGCPLIAKSV